MPFVSRVTSLPPLNVQLELEQIILVDQPGPVIPLGVSPGAACLVGEFLKGPFVPALVGSTGELLSIFGGFTDLLSQGTTGTQDGTGQRYEGNGFVALKGKQFRRLVIQRVNTDMVKTSAPTTKGFVKFSVTVGSSELDPNDATRTGKDILIPAGTRFADAAESTWTASSKIVALSQDVIIPKGTKHTASVIIISSVAASTTTFNCSQDPTTGAVTLLIRPLSDGSSAGEPRLAVPGSVGPTALFVRSVTATIGEVDTNIDTAIPNVSSGTFISGTPSTVGDDGLAAGVDAAGTGGDLQTRIESLYLGAIDKTRPTGSPQDSITVIWSARRGATAAVIRTPLTNNAINSSSEGRGRIAIMSGPRVGAATGDETTATAAKNKVSVPAGSVQQDDSPGRSDRKVVTFPYVNVFFDEVSANILVAPDGFMASTLSNFPEEKNPGARNEFIQSIQSFQEEFIASPLTRSDYVQFKANGAAVLRLDSAVGWWFQSGVTSVNPAVDQNLAPIKRRRMADFIQDTLASLGARYNKEPATTERVDALVGEIEAFLANLKSPPNLSLQRIQDFFVDATSGNTPQLVALGIFTIIVKVRLIASMDVIVFQTTIGETVEIEDAA